MSGFFLHRICAQGKSADVKVAILVTGRTGRALPGPPSGLTDIAVRQMFYDEFVKAAGPNLDGYPEFKVAILDNPDVRDAVASVVRRFSAAATSE
jgi:hypothetical protein